MLSFTAKSITGSGRGKGLGTATINLSLDQIPAELKEGIYAVFAIIDDTTYKASMHYGPRPVFKDSIACEVHLLDHVLESAPTTLTVNIQQYLRPVLNFESVEALKEQIAKDNGQARAILDA